MRVPASWRRVVHGLGVDFGAAGVKAVALAAEGDRTLLLGAAREPLPRGVVSDGAVRDPEAAAVALGRVVAAIGARCRVSGVAIGGSSVFVKRLPAPIASPDAPEAFHDAVAREAARHLPFHIESVEFDYQRPPDPAEGDPDPADRIPSLVFGAAPREMVRAHCDAASGAGRPAARLELEPYGLFAAARLEAGLAGSRNGPATGTDRSPAGVTAPAWAFIEIGAQRTGVHVFREGPQPAASPDAPRPPARGPRGDWRPADLLASVVVSGVGAEAVQEACGRDATLRPVGRQVEQEDGSTDRGAVADDRPAAGKDRRARKTRAEGHPHIEAPSPDVAPERVATASDRIAAALREALEEAGLHRPVVVRLSGGGALLPGIAASLPGLTLGRPTLLDPLRAFPAGSEGPEFALASGLALQQLPRHPVSPGRSP